MNSVSILFSGRGSNADYIISLIQKKQLNFKIKNIISNNKKAKGIELLKRYKLPINILDKEILNDKDYNQYLLEILEPKENDILLLCGYMLKVPSFIIDAYKGNVINIHPSLLPKYKGLNTHKKVIENKDTIHGCTTHFVNKDIDCGPIIAQYKISVDRNDNDITLADRLLKKEHVLFYKTLKLIENKEIYLENGKVYYKGNIHNKPIMFS
tara:strand:- start:4613 stop:5245 length:633 start_codon:yes stop_codon:yes gene_type:complete